jgi:hypothetical protein
MCTLTGIVEGASSFLWNLAIWIPDFTFLSVLKGDLLCEYVVDEAEDLYDI